jgi:hypothetical protein
MRRGSINFINGISQSERGRCSKVAICNAVTQVMKTSKYVRRSIICDSAMGGRTTTKGSPMFLGHSLHLNMFRNDLNST